MNMSPTSPRHLFALCLLITASSLALSYEPETTHRTMSRAAANQSSLGQLPRVLQDLGLKRFGEAQGFSSPYSSSRRLINEIIEDGARAEDAGARAFDHFFDPVRDAPLTFGVALGATSPDWALARSARFPTQQNSYTDARRYFLQALTAPLEEARNLAWGKTFASLGHVIHHLQDMAQPQHVRNDMHCDSLIVCLPIGLYRPSRYEA